MAAALKKGLGLDADLVIGDTGEFTVWIDGTKVASKQGDAFPTDAAAVEAARAAIKA